MTPPFLSTARIEEMKQILLNKIAELGKQLPLNTLDELIDKFGGPDKVSEVQYTEFIRFSTGNTSFVIIIM